MKKRMMGALFIALCCLFLIGLGGVSRIVSAKPCPRTGASWFNKDCHHATATPKPTFTTMPTSTAMPIPTTNPCKIVKVVSIYQAPPAYPIIYDVWNCTNPYTGQVYVYNLYPGWTPKVSW